jgi:hypothetical protein
MFSHHITIVAKARGAMPTTNTWPHSVMPHRISASSYFSPAYYSLNPAYPDGKSFNRGLYAWDQIQRIKHALPTASHA